MVNLAGSCTSLEESEATASKKNYRSRSTSNRTRLARNACGSRHYRVLSHPPHLDSEIRVCRITRCFRFDFNSRNACAKLVLQVQGESRMNQTDGSNPEKVKREISIEESDSTHIVRRLKASGRQELLTKLGTLFDIAFEGIKKVKKKDPRLQQKWVTTCGYLAQVTARIVTDLEYEKLRADVDELEEKVLENNVSRQRESVHHPENFRNPKAGEHQDTPGNPD